MAPGEADKRGSAGHAHRQRWTDGPADRDLALRPGRPILLELVELVSQDDPRFRVAAFSGLDGAVEREFRQADRFVAPAAVVGADNRGADALFQQRPDRR